MSTIAWHSTLNISETVRDRDLVPKDHQHEMAYGASNGHVTDDVTWPLKVKLVTPVRLERNISRKLLKLETSNLVCSFVGLWGMPNRRTNNFPSKWAWPTSRNPYNFWHTIKHIAKTTWAIQSSNLLHGFYGEWPEGAQIIFPKSGRGLGHVGPSILVSIKSAYATSN